MSFVSGPHAIESKAPNGVHVLSRRVVGVVAGLLVQDGEGTCVTVPTHAEHLFGFLLPDRLVLQDLVSFFGHVSVGLSVVGGVGVGVVAQHRQHGGDVGHVADHVVRYVAHPLRQRLQVDRFYYLVRGTFHPANKRLSVMAGQIAN